MLGNIIQREQNMKNLNLDTIKGLKKTSKAIILEGLENGSIKEVEDLKAVKGVGPVIYARICASMNEPIKVVTKEATITAPVKVVAKEATTIKVSPMVNSEMVPIKVFPLRKMGLLSWWYRSIVRYVTNWGSSLKIPTVVR